MPLVSVLMAVHNGAAHLAEALDSLSRQTLSDFELLVMDDGSEDNSAELLQEYAQRDARLKIFSQPNQGLTVALNRLWDHAQGRYLARMDADDKSFPERFTRQVAFLEQYPSLGGCGTWVRTFGAQVDEWHYPTESAVLRCRMLMESVIAHPTVMLRRALFEAHQLRYDEQYRRAQDYDLWLRATECFPLANLPEVLLSYRLGAAQTTSMNRTAQLEATERSYIHRLQALGLQPTPAELAIQRQVFTSAIPATTAELQAMGAWLNKIRMANQTSQFYPEPLFTHEVSDKFFRLCRQAAPILGIAAAKVLWQSPLAQFLPLMKHGKLWARAMTRLRTS